MIPCVLLKKVVGLSLFKNFAHNDPRREAVSDRLAVRTAHVALLVDFLCPSRLAPLKTDDLLPYGRGTVTRREHAPIFVNSVRAQAMWGLSHRLVKIGFFALALGTCPMGVARTDAR